MPTTQVLGRSGTIHCFEKNRAAFIALLVWRNKQDAGIALLTVNAGIQTVVPTTTMGAAISRTTGKLACHWVVLCLGN